MSGVVSDTNIFATMRGGGRIWAIAAIHGEAARLRALHQHLTAELTPGDQVVYLGDYLGYGPEVRATIDEMLTFRRAFIARDGVEVDDVVYLRGAQEEMWQKLLQLQFAPNPVDVLRWMVDHGIAPTVTAYGGNVDEGFGAAREGILALTRWTSALRQNMRAWDGHTSLMSILRHAAFTDDGQLLFVHAGLDPSRPLSAQMDAFWWGSAGFELLDQPYGGFRLVVRGSDRRRGGVRVGAFTASLDAGCGCGGPLTAACFGADGQILQMIEG
ncbi:MAG: metallophosphoesterase [Solirubrobacterales bacterium]